MKQTVVVCMVLAITTGVADALWNENNYPTDLVINAGSPQPWEAAEEVRNATANLVNGAGVWDSTVIVQSTGAVTSGRLWVGFGSGTDQRQSDRGRRHMDRLQRIAYAGC